MSASRDDQNPVDEFAAGDGLSITDLTEDDPWTAFAAEPAAPQSQQPAAAAWRPAVAGLAVAATVLAAAAGAYLLSQESAGLNEQIAEVIDNPTVLAEGAAADASSVVEADAPAVAATEVLVPPAEDVSGRAPSARADRTPVTRKRTARAPARQPKAPIPPPAAIADDSAPLSGDWVMNTRVESSELERYEGLRLGYVVNLQQDGDRISGTGWKVREDDRTIRAASRTPINFDGVMNGDRVELTFTEGGRRRTTAGKLVLARDSDDVLRGRFSSTAAQSVGVVEIRR